MRVGERDAELEKLVKEGVREERKRWEEKMGARVSEELRGKYKHYEERILSTKEEIEEMRRQSTACIEHGRRIKEKLLGLAGGLDRMERDIDEVQDKIGSREDEISKAKERMRLANGEERAGLERLQEELKQVQTEHERLRITLANMGSGDREVGEGEYPMSSQSVLTQERLYLQDEIRRVQAELTRRADLKTQTLKAISDIRIQSEKLKPLLVTMAEERKRLLDEIDRSEGKISIDELATDHGILSEQREDFSRTREHKCQDLLEYLSKAIVQLQEVCGEREVVERIDANEIQRLEEELTQLRRDRKGIEELLEDRGREESFWIGLLEQKNHSK